MTLGEKVKALRKERQMTQQYLAGDEITRNMLSAIEHGTALPSLGTLKLLADRLDVPAGYFLAEEDDLFAYQRMQGMPQIRKLMREGRYKEALDRATQLFGDRNDDETALARAESSCKCAALDIWKGAMRSALTHAENVRLFSAQTVYECSHLLAAAGLYAAVAKNPHTPKLEMREEQYVLLADTATERELYCYLTENTTHRYRNAAMATHIKGKQIMHAGRFEEAYRLLETLESDRSEISSYVMFRVYEDMEICARTRGDYENAYRMSTKRMSLLTVFKS